MKDVLDNQQPPGRGLRCRPSANLARGSRTADADDTGLLIEVAVIPRSDGPRINRRPSCYITFPHRESSSSGDSVRLLFRFVRPSANLARGSRTADADDTTTGGEIFELWKKNCCQNVSRMKMSFGQLGNSSADLESFKKAKQYLTFLSISNFNLILRVIINN